MKVALMLSGLPRMVEQGYNMAWKSIIDRYDTDVYLQSWQDASWGCDWQSVLYTYSTLQNVKSIHIQKPFKFTNYKEGIKLPGKDTSRPLPEYDVMSCFRQFPMVYSWQKVYQSVKDTQIDYDCIIRSRYDMHIHSFLDLEMLDLNKLNHSPCHNYLDDNFCITNNRNADTIFNNIFDRLVFNSRKNGILPTAEQSWTQIVNESGCEAVTTPLMGFSLLRENFLWWGDENGNVV